MGILPSQILRAYACAGADTHVLQNAIVNERERLAVAGRQKEDDPAVRARLAAVLLLGPVAVRAPRPGDDVGFHANREIAVIRAFHRAPAEVAVVAFAGEVHVDARPMDRTAGRQLPE